MRNRNQFMYIYIHNSIIIPEQSSDAGEYKCVATNDAGTSEGVAMLTVRGKSLLEPSSLPHSVYDITVELH